MRGLVCPLDHPFYLSSHLVHLTTIKIAVATMCCMFTGLCLSTIVMFLLHQPIACVWGLDLALRRVPGKVTAQTRRIPSRQQPLPSTLPSSVDSRTGEGSFILPCQPREATFTLKHCKREKIANYILEGIR